jgi:plasmid stability protein
MTMLTVRDLDPHVKEKLRRQAARHGRSMEAEVRQILSAAVEAGDDPIDLVSSIRLHFSDAPVQLELPDRSTEQQRSLDFSA